MTVKGKRIKTAYNFYQLTLQAAEGNAGFVNAADSWVAQEDISLRGVRLGLEIYDDGTGFDSGEIIIRGEISRVGNIDRDGSILEDRCVLICREAVVGINANQILQGDVWRNTQLWFPPDHGIDLDEDEALYLNTYSTNQMANDKRGYWYWYLYYTER